jgi:hypothetical protein
MQCNYVNNSIHGEYIKYYQSGNKKEERKSSVVTTWYDYINPVTGQQQISSSKSFGDNGEIYLTTYDCDGNVDIHRDIRYDSMYC